MNRGPLFQARGWSLVELLVAMTLSLLVIAGVGQIYLAAKRSYDIQTNLAQIQDVGRYVTDVLTQDIHMAGYWDLMNINDPLTVMPGHISLTITPDSCHPGNNNWGRMAKHGIFGLDNTDPAASIPAYDCISSWERGDALVVRYADPVHIPPAGPYTATRWYIQTTPLSGSFTPGNPGSPGPGVAYANHAIVAHAYYVANPIATVCGNVPVFAREALASNGTPVKESLVNGVEHMQFQYGVDTDGDKNVNQYLDATDVTDWKQVRAVRYWVLVRANCQEAGYSDNTTYQLGDITYTPMDHYRRALYSSTVTLKN